MIFAISDDKTVTVFDTVADMQGVCEGIDVEDGVYRFFDGNGKPLRAVFTTPNRRGKFLVASGVYDLIQDRDDTKTLLDCLDSSLSLEKNEHFKTIEAIKEFLATLRPRIE